MNAIDTDLADKTLRSRIDGLNFTYINGYEELASLSTEDDFHFKGLILNEQLRNLKSVFSFENKQIFLSRNKFVIDLTRNDGIYIESYFKDQDLFISIQFKGYFFVREDAFDVCRGLMIKLTEVYQSIFRLTLVDIAQDFLVSVDDLLPDPFYGGNEYIYGFKYKLSHHSSFSSKIKKYTGFVMISSRYKITVYDKIEENKGSKNPDKKKYYEDLYTQYEEVGVTRLELRLKQELCRDLTIPFYRIVDPESLFIKHALNAFYRKHKLRVQPPNCRDTNFKRWPVHPNWQFIFEGVSIPLLKVTNPDYRYTNGNKDVQKALHLLVDALVEGNPFMTKEDIHKKLEAINFDNILKKSEEKRVKRKRTKLAFNKIRDEVLERHQSKGWLDLGPGDIYNIPN